MPSGRSGLGKNIYIFFDHREERCLLSAFDFELCLRKGNYFSIFQNFIVWGGRAL